MKTAPVKTNPAAKLGNDALDIEGKTDKVMETLFRENRLIPWYISIIFQISRHV